MVVPLPFWQAMLSHTKLCVMAGYTTLSFRLRWTMRSRMWVEEHGLGFGYVRRNVCGFLGRYVSARMGPRSHSGQHPGGWPHLRSVVWPEGRALGSLHLWLSWRSDLTDRPNSRSDAVRAASIPVVRVVVVDVAAVVDIPRVVRVAPIAGAQPHVDSREALV